MRTICTATAGWGSGNVSRAADSLCLVYEHRSGVYHYRVSQAFHLTADTLTVTLSVTNQGAETLPFGTGWHPYFPLSPQTRIQAQASGYWLEREQWLAGEFCEQLPQGWISTSSRRCRASG